MMGAPFNAEALVTEALALVRQRRAKMAAEGFEGAGAFNLGRAGGDLLVMGGDFHAPHAPGGWKVLCRIPAGATHAETAPGLKLKDGPAGLMLTGKPSKRYPKPLAEGLDRMTPEALAGILNRLAPGMVRVSGGAPAKRRGITPLAAGVTGRRREVM